MLKKLVKHLLQKEQKVPEDFTRMVKLEFRAVPVEYVEYFFKKNKRLPSIEELNNAL